MAQNKHKYRVNVYLGKEMYEALSKEADAMNISLSTLTKIILTTGYEFAVQLEKGGLGNGEK